MKSLEKCIPLYNNVIVIAVVIANFEIRKIHMDSESVGDVLSYVAFLKMKFLINRLKLA